MNNSAVPQSQGDPKTLKMGPKGDLILDSVKRGPKIHFLNRSQGANRLKSSRNQIKAKFLTRQSLLTT